MGVSVVLNLYARVVTVSYALCMFNVVFLAHAQHTISY